MSDVEPVDPMKASRFDDELRKWQFENSHLPPEKYHKKKMRKIKELEEELDIR